MKSYVIGYIVLGAVAVVAVLIAIRQGRRSGRRAVLISGLAALLIGAGPGIVSFFFNTGTGVHSP